MMFLRANYLRTMVLHTLNEDLVLLVSCGHHETSRRANAWVCKICVTCCVTIVQQSTLACFILLDHNHIRQV